MQHSLRVRIEVPSETGRAEGLCDPCNFGQRIDHFIVPLHLQFCRCP